MKPIRYHQYIKYKIYITNTPEPYYFQKYIGNVNVMSMKSCAEIEINQCQACLPHHCSHLVQV